MTANWIWARRWLWPGQALRGGLEMLAKRIIPCLDVHQGRVVKGINFVDLRDAGDPVKLAAFYDKEGADELVFLDISASHEQRKTMIEVVRNTAREVFIPFAVGGGISSIDDIRSLLTAGADKVSINSAAVRDPGLISDGARRFGSQCIVVAIDARRRSEAEGWEVFINGGKIPTGMDALQWARQVEALGAGEILLTSMDKDGTKDGYDLELTAAIRTMPGYRSSLRGAPAIWSTFTRPCMTDTPMRCYALPFFTIVNIP